MSSPQRISNTEFQSGGIYPGGRGIIKNIQYNLWDYNGKQPTDSNTCVECEFVPTDGSNENKEVVINWNIGPSTDLRPDPQDSGFLLDMTGTGRRISDSCTWHQALNQGFMNNCAMKADALNGPKGIRALIGSEVTFIRMDPPPRQGFQQQQQGPMAAGGAPGQQQPQRINQVLVPTRASFAWEMGKGAAARTSNATAAAPAAGGAPAAASASAPASNGTGTSGDLAGYMAEMLEAENGTIDMKEFTAKLLTLLNTKAVKGKDRLAITRETKNADKLKAIAAENGWGLDELVIESDGKMSGSLYTQ